MSNRIPADINAEKALIGSVISTPEILPDIRLDHREFFSDKNRDVWDAITTLYRKGNPIDPVLVAGEASVGVEEVALYAQFSTPENYRQYAEKVRDTAQRRRMIAAASDIMELAANSDAGDVGSASLARIMSALPRENSSTRHVQSDVAALMDRAALVKDGKISPGIQTGFTELDKILNGFRPGEMTVVAGRPGSGKSAWLLSTMLNIASSGLKTCLFSIEMGAQQIINRGIAQSCGVDTRKIDSGTVTESEWDEWLYAGYNFAELPIYINDEPDINTAQIEMEIASISPDIWFVDYLQIVSPAEGRSRSTHAAVSAVSRELREISRRTKTPLVVAAQLNRRVEDRSGDKPRLSDLRESGQIEQDADVVIFLYSEDEYEINTRSLSVAKNRNGPTGNVSLFWDPKTTKFSNLSIRKIKL